MRYSPSVGRYLVAARDIRPLELVLWDAAAAVGPSADREAVLGMTLDTLPLSLSVICPPSLSLQHVSSTTSSEPVCLECFAKVDGSFACPRCQFPLCGDQCVGKRLHKAECEIFANLEKKINFSNLQEKHPVYTTIAPLRCHYYCSSSPKYCECRVQYTDRLPVSIYPP